MRAHILSLPLAIAVIAALSLQSQADATLEAKIAGLIESLATTEPKPGDDSKQIVSDLKVWEAADALHKLGPTAFPQLIAHFDDDRFSYSAGSPATSKLRQQSVGQLCWEIVHRQTSIRAPLKDVCDPRGTPGFGVSLVPRAQQAAEVWWQARRDKALWELQVEHVQTVIELSKRQLATETVADRRRLCEEAIKANEDLVATLNTEKKPHSTSPYRPYIGR